MKRMTVVSLRWFVLILMLTEVPAWAAETAEQEPPRPIEHYNVDDDGLALKGFDPVAYFPEGGDAPAEGAEDLAVTHREVTYRFASEENRELFLADPDRYEPAYGGWCAYAVADGQKVEVDPKAFLIQDDRLMVFYRTLLTDTRKPWKKDAEAYEGKADTRWEEISGEEPPARAEGSPDRASQNSASD